MFAASFRNKSVDTEFTRAWIFTHRIACRMVLLLLVMSHTALLQAQAESIRQESGILDFNRDVRPLLSENCFHCHGPDSSSREADLRLDVEESAKENRGDYSVIVPGNPAASELVKRVMSEDPAEQMPPLESGKILDQEEKKLLHDWIRQGANWSIAWAYQKPSLSQIPTIDSDTWSRNWIDRFILLRLQEEQVAPASEADNITLLRRLSFDLTGLPPTPEEIDQFVADKEDHAYERLVDRLLDSPHFGERMAVYWLDLVRFADTVGYHGDQPHSIWPYRDYVIYAFNQNMPFDQFTREQLAGDLLPDASEDQLIATGYNRLLQTSHEGGVQQKEYRAIYMADRVRNISQVWMGATMGCAQCHDHKYDPITTRDFYSMGAFFADIDDEAHLSNPYSEGLNGLPTIRNPEMEVLGASQRNALERYQAEQAGLDREHDGTRYEALSAEISKIEQSRTKTMIVRTCEPRQVRILPRGNWLDETGDLVNPQFPAFLAFEASREGRLTRLDLANWLVDTEQGIGGQTARVMVNRFWYLMFGRGIAPVLDDFGGQGQPPEHPELLDNLTMEFLKSGWDVKHMLRLIVLSSTYRQASIATVGMQERDPYNKLFARQSRYRVPAEMVRDAALRISGMLNAGIGGPSVKPYQPDGYYRHLNFPVRKYQHETDSQQWRRGLYIHWQRQFLHPMMRAFDAPSREECTAMRPHSNTPLAALTLLNDPTFVEAALGFAQRVLVSNKQTMAEKLEFAYRLALSRLPDQDEISLLMAVYTKSHDYYKNNPAATIEALSIGNYRHQEGLDKTELAAWQIVARVILNLSETTTRN